MSTTFLMRDRKATTDPDRPVFSQRVFHGAHSHTKLEIRGQWHVQGPQPVSDGGGVPKLVADIFDAYPQVQKVAVATDTGGSVFSRINHEVSAKS